VGLRQISLILDKRKNEEFLINKKTSDYEERNVEICVADTRGNTYRDSDKPRSAELHDDDVNRNTRDCDMYISTAGFQMKVCCFIMR